MNVIVHSNIKHVLPPIPDVIETTSDYLECWKYIIANWYCQEWQPIPNFIRKQIKFHPQLGMCNGSLVTKLGAKGMTEFINRVNQKENIK